MLKEILSPEQCRQCRFCCIFSTDDAWEIPTVDGQPLFEPVFDQAGLCPCPCLGPEGCRRTADKPLDCHLWPFRVMRLEGYLVLTLSPLCPATAQKTMAELLSFIERSGIADIAFEAAATYPQAVVPYQQDYPILKLLKTE